MHLLEEGGDSCLINTLLALGCFLPGLDHGLVLCGSMGWILLKLLEVSCSEGLLLRCRFSLPSIVALFTPCLELGKECGRNLSGIVAFSRCLIDVLVCSGRLGSWLRSRLKLFSLPKIRHALAL